VQHEGHGHFFAPARCAMISLKSWNVVLEALGLGAWKPRIALLSSHPSMPFIPCWRPLPDRL
jgi:hypothetical protein